ncbi:hypothetical protein [Nocardia terpenica]|uniref:Uncharacterized protein n=1 Tax=Nocardia terpenica TaxID=455432 RepID=A0A164LC57_9NOCA|nr:hypothetical protein [Nocardia terpenica]KZM72245.1 hypothetical protein AWN90_36840 [Nocardia terpenica]NQE86609.1 hypothetical protein [Nocardia terpenica]
MTTTHDDVTYADRVEAAHLGQVAILASASAGGHQRAIEELDNTDEFQTLASDVIANVLMTAYSRGEDTDAILAHALYHFQGERLPEAVENVAIEARDEGEFDICDCGCGFVAEETYITNVNGGLDILVSKIGGGITGQAYHGEWTYHVTRWGKPLTRPSKFTSRAPMTHRDVAYAVAEYFTEG